MTSGTGFFNNLAIDGGTLFMAYTFAYADSGLPTSGGIVAVPVSGGQARVVAAAENTTLWDVGSFWVRGGQVHLQEGNELRLLPADPNTPSTLPILHGDQFNEVYAHDAQFGYSALTDGMSSRLTVSRTAIDGRAPTVFVQETLPNVSLGGMADAGDALLLQVRWHPDPGHAGQAFRRVWRIPKDGSPHSDARPDVEWADSLASSQWLAWDGENILAPILNRNTHVQARVAGTGAKSPELLKLRGTVVTRRGDEILSLQTLAVNGAQGITTRILVASSKGAPAGTVLACGRDGLALPDASPAGIAADESGIYVAYSELDDTVIARVSE